MADRSCAIITCDDQAEYRLWFDDCESCRAFHGSLFCLGHSLCVEHTAKIRTGRAHADHVFLPDGSRADVPEGWTLMPNRATDAA